MAQLLSRSKFGNGHDGSPAVSGTINTYATCTGTVTQTSLTTTLAASAGDIILIHQSQGTGVGQWELNYVLADVGATLTLGSPLTYSYGTGAQAVLVPQYTGGTLNGAVTGTAWNGTVGGIIALMSNGVLTISGSLTVTGNGFLGASAAFGDATQGLQGEGTTGTRDTASQSANGNGAGGGTGGLTNCIGAGGGGGNGATGTAGGIRTTGVGGAAGAVAGAANLTTMVFGGGGGSGGLFSGGGDSYAGGNGSGIVVIFADSFTLSGTIVAGGNVGSGSTGDWDAVGGGGAGGSILIKARTAVLGTALATAAGGAGYNAPYADGGNGAAGRIHLDYYGSYTGTTTPTLDVTQDTNLTPPIYGGMI